VAGRVAVTPLDFGDTVLAGGTVIQIDATEYELAYQQAAAKLRQSQAAIGADGETPTDQLQPKTSAVVREAEAARDAASQRLERLRSLRVGTSISQTDLESAEADFEIQSARVASSMNQAQESIAAIGVAEADLKIAKRNLAETTIMAPFEGVIQERIVSEGTIVSPGQILIRIAKTDRLRFRGSLPERASSLVSVGQSVRLEFDFPSREIVGVISRISPIVDMRTRSLSFEVDVPNDDQLLRPGLFASASIVVDDAATALAIPESALSRFAGVDKVWLVVDGRAQAQSVQIGRRMSPWVEILDGLQLGDQVLFESELGREGVAVRSPENLPSGSDT
jgi:RND family efflux transporter MFP subunit